MSDVLKCQYCGSTTNKQGKPWAHRGALNGHEITCKLTHGAGGSTTQQTGTQEPQGGKWVPLDLNRVDHVRAYNAGYRKIHTTTGDLQ